MIVDRVYTTVAGLHTFTSPEIYGVRILQVTRGGRVLTEKPAATVIPTNDEFTHLGSDIDVSADIPFLPNEKITVIWEE